jgi:hypothetical protein
MKRNISWFLDIYQNGQLNLNPSYQRRSVWTLKDRKFFLDTIFRNYPSPAIFIHKEVNEKAGNLLYHVVDGKQRLETVIRFIQNDITIDKGYGDTKLNGKRWKEIEGDPELKRRFQEYTMPVEFIEVVDGNYVNEVFDRLNRNSRRLERQELRHAKYDGWFITTAEAEAEKNEWERLGVVTKARVKRMKDVQFISELLIVILKNRIDGFDQDYLDDIYAEYDSPYESIKGFNEDDFNNRLLLTKNYLLKMEDCNSVVTKYAKGFANFYSLWAFIALNQARLLSPEILSERYSSFISKVDILSKEKNPERFLKDHEDESYYKAYVYFRNLIQSSSDQAQREARNKVLESVLL